MRRILILASSTLFLPAFAIAQHHGGMVAAGHAFAAPTHIMAAPSQAGTRVVTGMRGAGTPVVIHHTHVVNGTVNRPARIIFSTPAFSSSFADTPGLGFDFAHLAAVNSGRMRHGHLFAGSSFGFDGFLFSSPGVIMEEGQPVEQPVVEEVAAANPNDVERGRRSDASYYSASSEPPAPQHDASEYVFVRRDGRLVFAVAYSWDNGTLHYITREGLRGSVTQGALDMEATQQFNDQRGVNFRSPA